MPNTEGCPLPSASQGPQEFEEDGALERILWKLQFPVGETEARKIERVGTVSN